MYIDYITSTDTIIFDPEYNKPLSLELNKANYKKIIFSDYELSDGLFEAYELNNNFSNFKKNISKFNCPLHNSLDKCTALTILAFGYY